MAIANNANLRRAAVVGNDEFYTRLQDIENELKNYKTQFKGKVVFCNCDDPKWSNFWKYFELNFEVLGLKKLISTHYAESSLWSKEDAYKQEITATSTGKPGKPKKTPLKGNGDFASPECIELLKEADIVVTNPPFTLFKEFLPLLVKHSKKFLVIGPFNAVTYKEIFPLIKNNQAWLGVSSRGMDFICPDNSTKNVNTCWFTNLTHKKRNEELVLTAKYKKNVYQKYDKYDAIEIAKVKDIPVDYKNVMGVPITFLDKYNPSQFEILGLCASMKYNKELVGIPFQGQGNAKPVLNGKVLYARIIIRNKQV